MDEIDREIEKCNRDISWYRGLLFACALIYLVLPGSEGAAWAVLVMALTLPTRAKR